VSFDGSVEIELVMVEVIGHVVDKEIFLRDYIHTVMSEI